MGRPDENYSLTDLEHFLDYDIDMFSVVIVGNLIPMDRKNNKMITPRGYKLQIWLIEELRIVEFFWKKF